MLRFLVGILIPAISLLSYTPGKYSPMDQYIFPIGSSPAPSKKLPSREIVRGVDGNVIYIAEYQYNSEGRLIREKYLSKDGAPDGETVFQYDKGKILREDLLDKNKTKRESKIFSYHKNGILKEITIIDGTGSPKIVWKIQSIKEGRILSAEGKYKGEEGNQEAFKVERDAKNPNLWIQSLLDEKKNSLGEVRYLYDSRGLLVEREYQQGDLFRRNTYEYNSNGLLESYMFHVKQGGQWELQKKHVLIYE